MLQFPLNTTDEKISKHKPVTFDDAIKLLEKHLALLPDDELSPKHLFRKKVMDKIIQDVADRAAIIENMSDSGAAISPLVQLKRSVV
jgi:hypothetical protein